MKLDELYKTLGLPDEAERQIFKKWIGMFILSAIVLLGFYWALKDLLKC